MLSSLAYLLVIGAALVVVEISWRAGVLGVAAITRAVDGPSAPSASVVQNQRLIGIAHFAVCYILTSALWGVSTNVCVPRVWRWLNLLVILVVSPAMLELARSMMNFRFDRSDWGSLNLWKYGDPMTEARLLTAMNWARWISPLAATLGALLLYMLMFVEPRLVLAGSLHQALGERPMSVFSSWHWALRLVLAALCVAYLVAWVFRARRGVDIVKRLRLLSTIAA